MYCCVDRSSLKLCFIYFEEELRVIMLYMYVCASTWNRGFHPFQNTHSSMCIVMKLLILAHVNFTYMYHVFMCRSVVLYINKCSPYLFVRVKKVLQSL